MIQLIRGLFVFLTLVRILQGCGILHEKKTEEKELLIAAAASMKNTLTEIKKIIRKTMPTWRSRYILHLPTP